jgi:hypothetical protein
LGSGSSSRRRRGRKKCSLGRFFGIGRGFSSFHGDFKVPFSVGRVQSVVSGVRTERAKICRDADSLRRFLRALFIR